MQLELAVATVCEATSCRVRLLDGDTILLARYSAPVQDAIKVRPGDLVAIDRASTPPEVVWRWWHGTVEGIEGGRAVVRRNVTQRNPGDPRTGSQEVQLAPEFTGRLHAGDTVFFGDHELRILDVARDGLPSEPDRLRAELFPQIVSAYGRRSDD